MNIREVDIDSLKVPEYCQREHGEEQVRRFVEGWRKNGQYQPIVVSDGEILCGVLVWLGMKAAGAKTILVNDLGSLPLERKKEIRYLDNQIFDIEDWDEERIKSFLMELDTSELDSFGFTGSEAEQYINCEPEPAPKRQKPHVEDIWECPSCGWTGRIDR